MEAKLEGAIKEGIMWEVDLKNEFIGRRKTGYSFVIDVLDGIPRLALYKMKINYSTSTTLKKQPPKEMLITAVQEQGGSLDRENLYRINPSVRFWIEEELLNKTAHD